MKKGFTLIELIITIGLLAIVGTVIVANMNGALMEQQEKEYQDFLTTLERAACTYIDSNVAKEKKEKCLQDKSCTVNLQTLISNGYLGEEDLFNPKTKAKISSSKVVAITYDGGIKKCVYND